MLGLRDFEQAEHCRMGEDKARICSMTSWHEWPSCGTSHLVQVQSVVSISSTAGAISRGSDQSFTSC